MNPSPLTQFTLDIASCGDRTDFDSDASAIAMHKDGPGRACDFFNLYYTGGVPYCQFFDRETGCEGLLLKLEDLLALLERARWKLGLEDRPQAPGES